jgi:hypothetical protein
MTQKELRTLARKTLAEFLSGGNNDVKLANMALQVLNAPDREGE